MYKIDDDVPVPASARGKHERRSGYGLLGAIRGLEVGQSLFVLRKCKTTQSMVSGCGATVRGQFESRRFTTRQVTEAGVQGVRIWRLDDAKPVLSVAAE